MFGGILTTKKSQEVFIQELEDKYPDRFTYDKVVYVNTHTKVIVTCKVHGDFTACPSSLLQGHSCPKCAIEKNRVAQTKTTEWFISKAKETHGDTFLYNKTQYRGQREKVTITCRVHGDIDVTPHQHIAGCGCIKCAMNEIRTTFQEFVEKSNSVHDNSYLYQDDGLFKGRRSKVNIICPDHGVFTQVAHNHLKGQGCPLCSKSGFKPNLPAWLYVLKIEGMPFTFTGYGISNQPERRLSKHKRNLGECGFVIAQREVLYCENGYVIAEIEKELKNKFEVDSRTNYIEGFMTESCFKSFNEVISFAKTTLEQLKENEHGN